MSAPDTKTTAPDETVDHSADWLGGKALVKVTDELTSLFGGSKTGFPVLVGPLIDLIAQYSVIRRPGLSNQGATDLLNCVLQILYSDRDLRRVVFQYRAPSNLNLTWNLSEKSSLVAGSSTTTDPTQSELTEERAHHFIRELQSIFAHLRVSWRHAISTNRLTAAAAIIYGDYTRQLTPSEYMQTYELFCCLYAYVV